MVKFNKLEPEDVKWFNAIRDSLSRDLLSKQWQLKTPAESHFVSGHCYVATEAAYHAFGRDRGLVPFFARLEGSGTHWWLAAPDHSAIVDLTHEQTVKAFPYADVGIRRHFLPGIGPHRESKRALELLRRAKSRLPATAS